MTVRPRKVLAVGAVFLLALVASGRPGGAAEEGAFRVVVAVSGTLNHIPNFVGLEKGFFLKHGLDAKLKVYQLGQHMSQAVQAGEAQLSGAAFSNFPVAVDRGFTSKAVVGMLGDSTSKYSDDPLALITRRDTGITQVRDLVGRKVGLPLGGTAHLYLGIALKRNSIPVEKVQVINVGNASMVSALTERLVDAVLPIEPYAELTLEKVPQAVLVQRGGSLVGYHIPMAATIDLMERQPEVVYRYAVGLAEAEQFARQHPDEAAEVATRWVPGLELPIAKKAMRNMRFDPRITKHTLDSWDENVRTLLEQKKMRQPVPWTRAIDLKFIQRVEKEYPQFFSDLKPVP